jgi:hypothetical protein
MGGGGGGKGGGGGGTSMSVDTTVTADTTIDSTVDIVGLDDINVRSELVLPQPFKTESKGELTFPKPIRTEMAVTEPIVSQNTSHVGLDIKPLTVDLCARLEIDSLPPTCIRQPYHHHYGITLFGIEIWGFDVEGESRTIIDDLPQRPQVVWGPEQVRNGPSDKRAGTQVKPDSGLRIRFDP